MNAIEILNRCRAAEGEIKRLDERIARYRACATDSSAHISRTGRAGSSVGDSVSAFAVEIADCEIMRSIRQQEYRAESYCACRLLDGLPETLCSVLYRYYIGGQTVRDIAHALDLTDGYVKSKKAEGLKIAGEIQESEIRAFLPGWYGDKTRRPTEHHNNTIPLP